MSPLSVLCPLLLLMALVVVLVLDCPTVQMDSGQVMLLVKINEPPPTLNWVLLVDTKRFPGMPKESLALISRSDSRIYPPPAHVVELPKITLPPTCPVARKALNRLLAFGARPPARLITLPALADAYTLRLTLVPIANGELMVMLPPEAVKVTMVPLLPPLPIVNGVVALTAIFAEPLAVIPATRVRVSPPLLKKMSPVAPVVSKDPPEATVTTPVPPNV